eukprot:6575719-Prorocentrum_lima.AAC.1
MGKLPRVIGAYPPSGREPGGAGICSCSAGEHRGEGGTGMSTPWGLAPGSGGKSPGDKGGWVERARM